MSKSNETAQSSGISFCGLLTILFIGLKLTNYISWSWWWVLSPLWLPISVILGFCLIAAIIYVISSTFLK